MSGTQLSGFGLNVRSDFPLLPGRSAGSPPGEGPDVQLRWVGPALPWLDPGAERRLVWETVFDECPFRVERDPAGNQLFLWGERASFRLSADASSLECAAAEPEASDWRRLLLDTVLWCVSLVHGYELLHASAIVRGDSAVAFVAGSGGGKSSLAAELMRRGAALLCDDVLALTEANGTVVGHPGPPVMNLPIAAPARPQPAELGSLLATFPDEYWIAVEDRVNAPRPLTGICVVERLVGASSLLQRWTGAPLALLPQFLGFPETTSRLAAQLHLAARIAAEVPVYLLTADPGVAPGVLAPLVEDAMFDSGLAAA